MFQIMVLTQFISCAYQSYILFIFTFGKVCVGLNGGNIDVV